LESKIITISYVGYIHLDMYCESTTDAYGCSFGTVPTTEPSKRLLLPPPPLYMCMSKSPPVLQRSVLWGPCTRCADVASPSTRPWPWGCCPGMSNQRPGGAAWPKHVSQGSIQMGWQRQHPYKKYYLTLSIWHIRYVRFCL
jgi:hypothetical protein